MSGNEAERYDVAIDIEHVGPTWEIRKSNVGYTSVAGAIEHARYIAPVGATVTVKITPCAEQAEPAYNLTEAGHAAIAD